MQEQIAILYPNGTTLDRWAVHIEADPSEEWDNAINSLEPGETAVRFDAHGIEIDRFRNCPYFTRT